MSNLQKQFSAIKQQLATETAATIARFKKVETDVADGFQDVSKRLEALENTVAAGFVEMRQATESQAKAQQFALDHLLNLVLVHSEE